MDKDAFEHAVRRHEGYARRVAMSIVRARNGHLFGLDAEDLVQAALLAIWEVSQRADLREDSDGYYHRSIRFAIGQELKAMLGDGRWKARAALYRRVHFLEELDGFDPHTDSGTEYLADYRKILLAMWDTINELPDRERKLLNLRYRYAMDACEACEQAPGPGPANRIRLNDARAAVAQKHWHEAYSIGIVSGVTYTPPGKGSSRGLLL